MVKYQADRLSATFAALADPTRRAILARLARGEATVGEIAEPFAMLLPAVSKHLTVLEGAGLLMRARDGRIRHCRIKAEPLARPRNGSSAIVGSGTTSSTRSRNT